MRKILLLLVLCVPLGGCKFAWSPSNTSINENDNRNGDDNGTPTPTPSPTLLTFLAAPSLPGAAVPGVTITVLSGPLPPYRVFIDLVAQPNTIVSGEFVATTVGAHSIKLTNFDGTVVSSTVNVVVP